MTEPQGKPRASVRRRSTQLFRRRGVEVSVVHWFVLDFSMTFATLFGMVLVIFRDSFLPSRFFLDGDFIRDVARGYAVVVADDSFRSVAEIYRFFGLADLPTLASLLGFGFGAAIIWCARFRFVKVPTVRVTMAFVLAMLMAAVYLGYYSKDVFVLPVVLVFLLSGRGRFADILLIASAVLYAIEFRGYWLLIAALYIGFLIVLHRSRRKLPAAVAGAIVTLVIAGLVLPLVFHIDATHYRDVVNVDREGIADAATVISPLVNSRSIPGGILNLLAAFVGFIVPVPLLALGGAYYAVISLLFAVIWITVGLAIRGISSSQLPARGGPSFGERGAALLAAFLVTQSLFEPDYGSALRHLTPLLVVAAALIAFVDGQAETAAGWGDQREALSAVSSRATERMGR